MVGFIKIESTLQALVSMIDRKSRCNPNHSLMKHIQRLNLIPEGMDGRNKVKDQLASFHAILNLLVGYFHSLHSPTHQVGARRWQKPMLSQHSYLIHFGGRCLCLSFLLESCKRQNICPYFFLNEGK